MTRIEAEYSILTFKILSDIRTGQISYFAIRNLILTFELSSNIEFYHSKSYFDIRIEAEYRILTFEILLLHSNWSRISHFDIRTEAEYRTSKIRSKSYFDIQTEIEYHILTLNGGGISTF